MVRRQIDLDEQTDILLTSLAEEYEGDAGKALAGLLRAHESLEAFAEESESASSEKLRRQKERSEREFEEGRFTTWAEVKRRNKL